MPPQRGDECERVVWVEKVFDQEAPIYEAPQNGNYKLFDIIDGGFVIWPECRVRCLQDLEFILK